MAIAPSVSLGIDRPLLYHIGMNDLPVMLRVADRRCVIVGGGSVALRRARALLDSGARLTIIAPEICKALDELAFATGARLTLHKRPYQPRDLDGVMLVVVATDSAEVNDQVARDALAAGVLINRTDDPTTGDFAVMAHERRGPLTVSVHTGGISASAAATIRAELLTSLDPLWITLLETASPFRARLQQMITEPEPRQAALRRLADDEAMARLRSGGADALRSYYESLLTEWALPTE